MKVHDDNTIVLKVIQRGLDTLGETSKKAIWIYLEEEFEINSEDLPRNIRALTEGLEKIFGVGYKFLDALFCKFLEEETGEKFSQNKKFCEQIENMYTQNVPYLTVL